MTGKQFLSIVEMRTKVVSVSSFLIGTVFAFYTSRTLQLQYLILWFIAVLAVDMGTTAFNSYFDFVRKIDSKNHTKESDKILLSGAVRPVDALAISLMLYLFAVFIGIALTFKIGWPVLAAGAAGLGVGYFYNGGPLPISRTPLGELFAGGFLGFVLIILTFYVQTGTITRPVIAGAIPSTLIIGAILTVNNTCDMKGDRAGGRLTLSLLIGRRLSVILIALLIGGAYGILLFLSAPSAADFFGIPFFTGQFRRSALYSGFPPGVLFTAFPAVVFSFIEYGKMVRRGFSHATKSSNIGSIIKIFLIYTLSFLAGIALSLIIE